jgi:sulfite reductase (NADPH) flavoprotein alpha-component
VQWPAAPGGPARNPIRDRGAAGVLRFPTPSGRAVFHPRRHAEPAERPDDAHPFTFNTGRLPHQWHTMTKTGKVARLNRLDEGPFVEIHPGDAATLDVEAGDLVEVASRRGRAVLPAVVTDRVRPGSCFAPIHWNDRHGEYASVNAVTNDAVDPVSLQPELKVCAVALTKVATPSATLAAPATGPLAALLGVRPPTLSEQEALYVGGFVTALQAAPPASPPALPATAPVSPAVRMWVDGLLAGTFLGTPAPPTAEPAVGTRRISVLWASQTGNAQDLAASIAAHLSASELPARAVAMHEVGVDALAGDHDVLVVTSTYGAGDPPDNGAVFWRALAAAGAPVLEGVRYAVVALGDPSYADFCGHGRRLDERLAELGATRLLPRLECDPDFGPPTTRWLDEIVPALRRPATRERRSAGAGQPFQASRHGEVPTRTTPLLARLAGNRLLTGPGSAKEVRELVIDTSGSALTYEAGDSLGVWPTNCPDLVAEWLDVIGADADTVVEVAGVGELALGAALRDHLEIARVTPGLIRLLAASDGDRELELLARSKDAAALARFAWGRQAVDVARAAGIKVAAQDWIDVLTRLQPRQYSISSSPLVDPHRIRITASIVRYRFGERTRKGVCSTFLADSGPDATVPVFVSRAPHFRIPAAPSAPAVMIGPGTGIAPFLGFLADRRARGHDGANWLFFGEQRKATDHYYRDELAALQADGVLHHLDLAFSRDQRAKVYVQDRMREHGARLWSWLQDGASVYVCGDMARMATDVDAALHDIVATHGGLDAPSAAEYVQHLAATGRYARDVY